MFWLLVFDFSPFQIGYRLASLCYELIWTCVLSLINMRGWFFVFHMDIRLFGLYIYEQNKKSIEEKEREEGEGGGG